MIRRRAAIPALLAGCVCGLAGCATRSPLTAADSGVNDPSFGLPRDVAHRAAGPLDRTPVWRTWSKGDHGRLPVEFDPSTPLEAVTARHPSWVEDDPIEIKPNRAVFFLSGFLAGAVVRIGIAAASGSAGKGVTGNDFTSAVMIGAVTGIGAWSYSFRLPPASLDRRLQKRILPEIKDTRTWQDWGPGRE